MSLRVARRRMKAFYKKHYTNPWLVKTVDKIVGEIIAGEWSDQEPMGFGAVGEIKAIGAFWTSDIIISLLVGAVQGRMLHFLSRDSTVEYGEDALVVGLELVQETELQREEVEPIVKLVLREKYGEGAIDLAALAVITGRAETQAKEFFKAVADGQDVIAAAEAASAKTPVGRGPPEG